jgi:hypothetical protein
MNCKNLKTTMKFVLFLCILIMTLGCVQNSPKSDYKPGPDKKLADKIMYQVAVQLQREKNLRLYRYGSEKTDQVGTLALHFIYDRKSEIEEERALVLFAANLLLKAINNDEQIRPYLKNYPLLPENILIIIVFNKPYDSDLDPDRIHVVILSEGTLRYEINIPHSTLFETLHTETFQQATEQLKGTEKRKAMVNL